MEIFNADKHPESYTGCEPHELLNCLIVIKHMKQKEKYSQQREKKL